MRFRSIVREAALNVVAGTSHAAGYSLIFAILLVFLAGAEIATVTAIQNQAAQFQSSGGSTLIYRMASGINPTACDSLSKLAGVSASGAIRQETGETLAALPGGQVPTFEISPGFGGFQALGNTRPGGGVLISQDLAETLGIEPGQKLELADGQQPRVGGIFPYPQDGRQPGYGYSILSPVDATSAFSECWVQAWPISEQLIALLPTTLLPGTVQADPSVPGPQLTQLNASHGTNFDGSSLYNGRITRFAPDVAVVATACLGIAAVLRRRLELASARHAGVSPASQALQLSLETFSWLVIGIILTLPILGLPVLNWDPAISSSRTLLAFRIIAAAAPAALLGTILSTLMIREKYLFRYFKSR